MPFCAQYREVRARAEVTRQALRNRLLRLQKQEELSRRRTRLARRQLTRVMAVQSVHAAEKAAIAAAVAQIESDRDEAKRAYVASHRAVVSAARQRLRAALEANVESKRAAVRVHTAAAKQLVVERAIAVQTDEATKRQSHYARRRERHDFVLRREQQRLYDLARAADERRLRALEEKRRTDAVTAEVEALARAQHALAVRLHESQQLQRQVCPPLPLHVRAVVPFLICPLVPSCSCRRTLRWSPLCCRPSARTITRPPADGPSTPPMRVPKQLCRATGQPLTWVPAMLCHPMLTTTALALLSRPIASRHPLPAAARRRQDRRTGSRL
jgi:hypothetical protein